MIDRDDDQAQLALPLPPARMKFKVQVQMTAVITYDEIEVEAASEQEAEEIAEHDRLQGALGTPTEAIECVDFFVTPAGNYHYRSFNRRWAYEI